MSCVLCSATRSTSVRRLHSLNFPHFHTRRVIVGVFACQLHLTVFTTIRYISNLHWSLLHLLLALLLKRLMESDEDIKFSFYSPVCSLCSHNSYRVRCFQLVTLFGDFNSRPTRASSHGRLCRLVSLLISHQFLACGYFCGCLVLFASGFKQNSGKMAFSLLDLLMLEYRTLHQLCGCSFKLLFGS